jgi:hypothetical protein
MRACLWPYQGTLQALHGNSPTCFLNKLMVLTMPPTGLGHGVYKDDFDVVIYDDGEAVGRIL